MKGQGMKTDFFDEGIKLISYCHLCEIPYSPQSAQVLGEKQDSHLLHIECGECGCAIIALVLISSAGISSIGLVTDLSYHRVLELGASRDVDADDVIAIHDLMKDGPAFWSRISTAAKIQIQREIVRPSMPPKPKTGGWRIWSL